MPCNFSTTLRAAGSTLLIASSNVSFACSMASPRAARTVPPISGSSIWTTTLPPSWRGNSTRRFIGLLHLAWFFYRASFTLDARLDCTSSYSMEDSEYKRLFLVEMVSYLSLGSFLSFDRVIFQKLRRIFCLFQSYSRRH